MIPHPLQRVTRNKTVELSWDNEWAIHEQLNPDDFSSMTLVALNEGTPARRFGRAYGHPAFSPDSSLLAWIGEGGVCLGEVANNKVRWQTPLPDNVLPHRHCHALQFSPDGKSLVLPVTGEGLNCLKFDVATGNLGEFGSGCRAIRFSPDGRGAVKFGMETGTHLLLVDPNTGATIHELRDRTNLVTGAAFSADGRTLASVSVDGAIRLWQTSTGQELLSIKTGKVLYECRFSRDGNTLIVWSHRIDGNNVDLHIYRRLP